MAETNDPVVAQQPVVTDEQNTKIVKGFDALSLPTPDKVKAVFKMITFFTIVIGLVANGIAEIPPDAKKQILEYMGVLILILQKAEDFWGIKITS
ncbi:MAG TPA: hypothetical protein VN922_17090 [Bacteroidia bacterium]|nr:hypothetical protein [Bacteroidia bacterium]